MQIGSAVGRTEQSVYLWMRGATEPRFKVIEDLASLFECHPRDLFEDGDV